MNNRYSNKRVWLRFFSRIFLTTQLRENYKQGGDCLKNILLLLLALLFVAGCTKEGQLDATKTIGTAEKNTSAPESKLDDVEKRLLEAESRLTQIENLAEAQFDLINTNRKHLKQAHHLLNNIPTLEVKKGYITNFDSKKALQVQLVNFLDDPGAPNGFRLEMTDVVPIKLSNKALIYYELGTREVLLDEFMSHEEDYRLYDIYLINNEIIMLAEMYVP